MGGVTYPPWVPLGAQPNDNQYSPWTAQQGTAYPGLSAPQGGLPTILTGQVATYATGTPTVSDWTAQDILHGEAYPGPLDEIPVDGIPSTVWVPESSQ
jgi:hypothetical protein